MTNRRLIYSEQNNNADIIVVGSSNNYGAISYGELVGNSIDPVYLTPKFTVYDICQETLLDVTQLSDGRIIVVSEAGNIYCGKHPLTLMTIHSSSLPLYSIIQMADDTIIAVGLNRIVYGKDTNNMTTVVYPGNWKSIVQLSGGGLFMVGHDGAIAYGHRPENLTITSYTGINWNDVTQLPTSVIVIVGDDDFIAYGQNENSLSYIKYSSTYINNIHSITRLNNYLLVSTGSLGEVYVIADENNINSVNLKYDGFISINDTTQLLDETIILVGNKISNNCAIIVYGEISATNIWSLRTGIIDNMDIAFGVTSLVRQMKESYWGINNGSFEKWIVNRPIGWRITSSSRGFGWERTARLSPQIQIIEGNEAFNFYRWGSPYPELSGTILLEQTGINVDTNIYTKLIIDICTFYFNTAGKLQSQRIAITTGLKDKNGTSIVYYSDVFTQHPVEPYPTSITLTIPSTHINTILTDITFYYEVYIETSSTSFTTQRHAIDNIRFE